MVRRVATRHQISCIDLDKVKLKFDHFDVDKSGATRQLKCYDHAAFNTGMILIDRTSANDQLLIYEHAKNYFLDFWFIRALNSETLGADPVFQLTEVIDFQEFEAMMYELLHCHSRWVAAFCALICPSDL